MIADRSARHAAIAAWVAECYQRHGDIMARLDAFRARLGQPDASAPLAEGLIEESLKIAEVTAALVRCYDREPHLTQGGPS